MLHHQLCYDSIFSTAHPIWVHYLSDHMCTPSRMGTRSVAERSLGICQGPFDNGGLGAMSGYSTDLVFTGKA